MAHKCEKCIYMYKTTVNDGRNIYNALADEVMTVSVRRAQECCGSVPGGQVLDKEQPRCKDYEE